MQSDLYSKYEQVERMRLVEKRLIRIDQQLLILKDEIKDQEVRVQREYQDVVKLEGSTLGQLFSKVLSEKRENQLEIERQEYLQAVLTYDALVKEVEVLRFEKDVLSGKLEAKDAVTRAYQNALKQEEQNILNNTPEIAIDISHQNRRIAKQRSTITEIDEVLIVGRLLLSNLEEVVKMVKGVDTGYMRNYAFVQKSKKVGSLVASINVLFNKYFEEMLDVYPNLELSLHTFKVQRFVSSFYDRMISDYISSHYRAHTIGELQFALNKVENLQENLLLDRATSEKKLRKAEKDKEEIIMHYTQENS